MGSKNDVKNNMNSENESEYLKVFNKLHEKKLLSLKNKGVFWCLKTNKEISMEQVQIKKITSKTYYGKYKISKNNELVKEIVEEQQLDKNSNFYLVVTLEENCKQLNCVGIKISRIGNYVVVFHKGDYLILSRQFYKEKKKELFKNEQSYIIQMLNGEQLLNMECVNPFDKIKEIYKEEEEDQDSKSQQQYLKIYSDNYENKTNKRGSGIELVSPLEELADNEITNKIERSLQQNINEEGILILNKKKEISSYLEGVKIQEREVIQHKCKELLKDQDLLLSDEVKEIVEMEKYYWKDREVYLRSMQQVNFMPIVGNYNMLFRVLKLLQAKTITNANDQSEYSLLSASIIDEDTNNPVSIRISTNSQWGVPLPILLNNHTHSYLVNSQIIISMYSLVSKQGLNAIYYQDISSFLPRKYQNTSHHYCFSSLKFNNMFISAVDFIIELKRLYLSNQSSSGLELMIMEGIEQNEDWLGLSLGLSSVMLMEEELNWLEKQLVRLRQHFMLINTAKNKISKFNTTRDQLQDMIRGSIKLDNQRKYGQGVDSLRFYLASIDDSNHNTDHAQLLLQNFNQTNTELNLIRKTYWHLFRIINANTTLQHSHQLIYHIDSYSFIHQFVYDHLLFLLVNTNIAYSQNNTHKVYTLILDFFKTYILDLYIPYIQYHALNQPKSHIYLESQYIVQQIIQFTLTIISPIVPFNAQNIYSQFISLLNSSNSYQSVFSNKWPKIDQQFIEQRLQNIHKYEFMLQVRNNINEIITNNKVMIAYFQGKKESTEKYNQKLQQLDIVFLIDNEISIKNKLLFEMKDSLQDILGFREVKLQTLEDNIIQELTAMLKIKIKINLSQFQDQPPKKLLKKTEFEVKIYKKQCFQCVRCLKHLAQEINVICQKCNLYLNKFEQIESI